MKTVHIESPGPTGVGTKVTTEDGALVHGIRKMSLEWSTIRPTVAKLEILGATITGRAQACFGIIDPLSGEWKEVRRVEFTDGSVFDAGA